jgi:putative ABC transport system permease protein
VLAFTAALTILTAVVFGLWPAWQAATFDLHAALKEKQAAVIGDWRRHFGRNLLVVGEVALSLVLLAGAGLLVKSFLRLQRVQPAIAADQLLTVEINLPAARYPQASQASGFFQELARRVEGLPGVAAASLGTARPLSGAERNDPFAIEGRPLDPANLTFAGWQMAGANYFATTGIPLIHGRDLTARDMDQQSPPVAVINETMARRYWPGEIPIGRRITLGLPRPDNPWVTIVGIVKDLPHRTIESAPAPEWYLARPLGPQRNQILFVRTAKPAALASAVREVVASLDRDQPVTSVQTMNQVITATEAPRRFNLLLFAVFAAFAVVLAALGLYGVMSDAVAQRTHEVGIRMALGARKSEVLALIMKQGLVITGIGIIAGVVMALALTRLLASLLFGVTPTDVATFVCVAGFIALVALIASYLPARRATKVDPLTALRCE